MNVSVIPIGFPNRFNRMQTVRIERNSTESKMAKPKMIGRWIQANLHFPRSECESQLYKGKKNKGAVVATVGRKNANSTCRVNE
jgi:hypothetical protein